MTIFHILPEMNSGGVEMHVLELAQHQKALGHRVIILSGGGKLAEKEWIEQGGPHITMPIGRKNLLSLRLIPALRSLFLKHPNAIIHTHSRAPAWLTFLAWRGLPREKRPRFITTIHGFNSINRYSAIMTRGERVICVSESIRNYALQHYPSCPAEHTHTIYGGISLPSNPASLYPSENWKKQWYQDFPETHNKRLITLPGRLTRLKGHLTFLEILEQLPNLNLVGVIAGDAHQKKQAYLKELKQLVIQKGLQNRVVFTGFRRDLPTVMAHSDLVLSLTTKPEAFGRTILEALLLHTPVIGYNYGGAAEIFSTLFPQGAVPPNNPSAVRNKILEFLDQPPTTPNTNPFTWESSTSKHLTLYQQLLDSPP